MGRFFPEAPKIIALTCLLVNGFGLLTGELLPVLSSSILATLATFVIAVMAANPLNLGFKLVKYE